MAVISSRAGVPHHAPIRGARRPGIVRRGRRAVTLLAAAALAWGAGTPAHASPAPRRLAVLGDSYSAGVGTRDKKDSCYQSPRGYGPLAATAEGWILDYRACSGAVTAQVTAQADGLPASTGVVSLTSGGNDAGFSTVITQCALPSWLGDCTAALRTAAAVIDDELPGRLATLHARVRAEAPRATVVQLGYPRLFNGHNCSWITFFSAREMTAINRMADTLDAVEQRAAARDGVRFVDVRSAFTGHAVCDRRAWINDLTVPTDESFHPNRAGQVGYELALLHALGDDMSPARVGRSGSQETSDSADVPVNTSGSSTDQEVVLAGRQLPRLTGPAYLARARRAGVSAATMRRLDADLHSGDARHARAAWTRLHQISATR